MLPPTDSAEAGPKAGDGSPRADTGSRISFEESTGQHLEAALRADDAPEKDYHIRSAIQRVMIVEATRSE